MGDGAEGEDYQAHEGYAQEDHCCEEGGGQEGDEGSRKEECACHEEEGHWHLRAQGSFAGVGDHLLCEEVAAHRGDKEDLGLHQEELLESGPHDQAGFHPESHLPGGEHRHAQDGRLRQQAPVVSPWASPGDSAEEFHVAPGSRVATARVRLLSFDIGYTHRFSSYFSSCPLVILACSFERRRGWP